MNNILNILTIIIISIYIVYNKNIHIIKLFNNDIFKIIILFIMIIISNKQPVLSLLLCISYIITIQNNTNEPFNNCSCGSQVTNNKDKLPFCSNPTYYSS
jgi:hypothetical protein